MMRRQSIGGIIAAIDIVRSDADGALFFFTFLVFRSSVKTSTPAYKASTVLEIVHDSEFLRFCNVLSLFWTDEVCVHRIYVNSLLFHVHPR